MKLENIVTLPSGNMVYKEAVVGIEYEIKEWDHTISLVCVGDVRIVGSKRSHSYDLHDLHEINEKVFDSSVAIRDKIVELDLQQIEINDRERRTP